MFTRRIFFGVITTWVLLEGSKGLWRLWGQMHAGERGLKGALADDVMAVTG